MFASYDLDSCPFFWLQIKFGALQGEKRQEKELGTGYTPNYEVLKPMKA